MAHVSSLPSTPKGPDSLAVPVDGALHIASRRIEDGPVAIIREPWSGAEARTIVLADEARAEEAVVACVRAFERLRVRTSYERKVILARVAGESEARQEMVA